MIAGEMSVRLVACVRCTSRSKYSCCRWWCWSFTLGEFLRAGIPTSVLLVLAVLLWLAPPAMGWSVSV